MHPTLDELRARFEADPASPAAYAALVGALSTGTEPRELAELHERWAEAASDPLTSARALAHAGEQREAFGDVERAVRHYTRALELDPRQALAAEAFTRLASERRDVHRYVEQLTQWLARLVEVGASNTERAEVELALARAHAAIPGRLDRCFEHHRAAVALDPELEGTLDESIERARQARRISDVRALLALAVQSTRSDERRLTLLRTLAEAQQAVPADLDGAIDSLAAAGALVPDDVPLLEERLALTQQRARRKRGADAERADLDVVATLHVELARRLPLDAALEAVERALAAQPAHGEALALLEALVAQDPTAQNRARVGKALAARVDATSDRAGPAGGQPHSAARLAFCDWLEREGRPADAYDALAPLLTGAPPNERLARGLALAQRAERWNDAARLTQRLHAGASQAAHERVALEALLEPSLEAPDVDAAEAVAERLLELVPDHAGALKALTRVHVARAAHGPLRGVLERRLGLRPDSQAQRALLRQLVALADGPLNDAELATDAFQKLAELDPRDAALRRQLLERLEATKRYRAIADVRRWEIASLESLADREAALDALLDLAREHPFDTPLLVDALRTYRRADPTNADARATLVRVLHGSGELEEAASLLHEAARAAVDTESRLAALEELAAIYDLGLRDDDAARTIALQTLELAPDNEEALQCLEHVAKRTERHDWFVEALEHRARSLPDRDRADVYLRLARLHESAPDDAGEVDQAMEAYAWVRALRPDDEAAAALVRLYETHSRHKELADLLDDLASETTDLETRVVLLKRRATLLRDVLGDADEAASCYREVRSLREDEDALEALLEHTRAGSLHAELAELLATRLALGVPPEEAIELGMERATLLLDHLAEPRAAERELLAIRASAPGFAPALARLGALYLDEDKHAQLADVTEAHLALTTHPAQRAALAQRLFALFERALPDADRALGAARHWVHAAPTDLDALRAVAERLDAREHAAELVQVLNARADEITKRGGATPLDAALRDEALRALEDAVVTLAERLSDVEQAEERLLLALDLAHDDEADVDRFVRVAASVDAALGGDRLQRAVATSLARKATAVSRPLKERLFVAATNLFGGPLDDVRLAFEVARRGITECSDDPTILQALVDFGRGGGFEEELDVVLAERFEASLDAKAARALQRERADLLYTLERFGDAADAYHRLASMEPDNAHAKERHRECLVRAERYQDLLVTLDQALRRLGSEDSPARTDLLREVARTWETGLVDRGEATDAWKAVLSAAPDDAEATAALERLAASR